MNEEQKEPYSFLVKNGKVVETNPPQPEPKNAETTKKDLLAMTIVYSLITAAFVAFGISAPNKYILAVSVSIAALAGLLTGTTYAKYKTYEVNNGR